MTLNEIIETVKHDIDYFKENHNNFQRGRYWQAQKILDMLYQLEPAQLQQHGIMQAEGSDGAEGAAVASERMAKSVCVCKKLSPLTEIINGVRHCAVCNKPLPKW